MTWSPPVLPAATRRRVRWGFGDALGVALISIVLGTDLRYVGYGVAAAIGVNLLVALPNKLWTDAGKGSQQIGNDLKHAGGLVTVVLLIAVVFLAPFAEELLFRGYVLRSSLRHWSAVPSVLVAGIVFGVFHLG